MQEGVRKNGILELRKERKSIKREKKKMKREKERKEKTETGAGEGTEEDGIALK